MKSAGRDDPAKGRMAKIGQSKIGPVAAVALASVAAGGVHAQETVTYRYDALGRLIRIEHQGTANHAINTNYQYDKAGNRTEHATAAGLAPVPPPALPEPLPDDPPDDPPDNPPPNQPPVTASDTLDLPRCTTGFIDVVANDGDPDGHLPLTLVAVTPGTRGTAFVANSTTVGYVAGITTGGDALTYTIEDSLGASAQGSLLVNVTPGDCGL